MIPRSYFSGLILALFTVLPCLTVHAESEWQPGQHHELQAKHRDDYTHLKNSTGVLLEQYRRISEEKQQPEQAAMLAADLDVIIAMAEQAAGQARYVEARRIIRTGYQRVQQGIIALRNGEQLVNSLDFETAEDEFAYYRIKIDSQLKAIQILSPQLQSETKRRNLEQLLSVAQRDYDQAVAMGEGGQVEQALPLMEKTLNRLRAGLMMVASPSPQL